LGNWVLWKSGDSTNTNVNTAWKLDDAVSHESDDWNIIVIIAIKNSEHYHINIKVVSYRYCCSDFTALGLTHYMLSHERA